ncbi:MAG: hypothetical protein QOI28_3773 [Mycobacterium sp.]|jgi:hypothetical protein|nr:hypothetical protein [Mycobacterium sp.]
MARCHTQDANAADVPVPDWHEWWWICWTSCAVDMPVVQAGMADVAGAVLPASVAEASGLGVIGSHMPRPLPNALMGCQLPGSQPLGSSGLPLWVPGQRRSLLHEQPPADRVRGRRRGRAPEQTEGTRR